MHRTKTRESEAICSPAIWHVWVYLPVKCGKYQTQSTPVDPAIRQTSDQTIGLDRWKVCAVRGKIVGWLENLHLNENNIRIISHPLGWAVAFLCSNSRFADRLLESIQLRRIGCGTSCTRGFFCSCSCFALSLLAVVVDFRSTCSGCCCCASFCSDTRTLGRCIMSSRQVADVRWFLPALRCTSLSIYGPLPSSYLAGKQLTDAVLIVVLWGLTPVGQMLHGDFCSMAMNYSFVLQLPSGGAEGWQSGCVGV